MIDPKKIEEWKAAVAEALHLSREAYESCPEAYDLSFTAIDAVPALLSEREEMLAVLREVEWEGVEHDIDSSDACCPVCRNLEIMRRHLPDCRLAALLKG